MRANQDFFGTATTGVAREFEGARSLSARIMAIVLSVAAASQDILVDNPLVKRLGLRGLHGVPLLAGDHVIGVALMGSTTAEDFSAQDKRVFAAMAARATTAIVEQRLSERAERAAADCDFREAAVLVVGSEARGVSLAIQARAAAVNIPTAGVESLNAGIAAAILLYEARRQRTDRRVP